MIGGVVKIRVVPKIGEPRAGAKVVYVGACGHV